MSGLSVDPRNLIDALLFVERASGRAMADSMNRAQLHTIIGSGSYPGAMQLTPKATRSRINQVTDRQLAGFVIARAKRSGRWPMTNSQIHAAVRKERARRNSAVGYHAYAGWSNAAKAMGGRGVRGVTDDFSKSAARHGRASRATVSNKESVATNTAPAIERIGFAALQQAQDNAAKDLVDYGTRKLQEAMNKVKP
jgi:hypothetical protein